MAASLNAKKILLGISGGIAAYKSAELARLLIKEGADVRVVMTPSAQHFVAPLSLQAITGAPVRTQLFELDEESAMSHIELARWADQILIAPASADLMARLAVGMANDLLTTLCLAARCPMVIAPAMNSSMWSHAATQHNLALLQARGVQVLGPDVGELACGEAGVGRMLEPGQIVARLSLAPGLFQGKKVVLTAGPTREAIDPVRYISNRSSGKMGYALARAFVEQGAEVILVSGPTSLSNPVGVRVIRVESALEMAQVVSEHVDGADVFAAVAAVSDYRVERPSAQKLKKHEAEPGLELRLVRNPDILAEVANRPQRPKFVMGFAAETEDLAANAQKKLIQKGIDLIAANAVGEGLGFDAESNQLHLYWQGGGQLLPLAPKQQLARDLVAVVFSQMNR